LLRVEGAIVVKNHGIQISCVSFADRNYRL
jgi:hypothetical protein